MSFSECSYGPRHFLPHKLVFYPEKSTQNGLKIHFKTRLLLIDHSLAGLDIVYSSPPSVLITLLNSRFRNARLFFAHCLISCRGIMEVGTAYQYTSLNPSRHLPDFERLIMTRHQVTLPGPGHTTATTRCYPQLKLANITGSRKFPKKYIFAPSLIPRITTNVVEDKETCKLFSIFRK